MKITILTIFPNLFQTLTENTIIKRAIANNLVNLNIVNIRDYTKDKYKRVDTPPIGGGSGLIMKCQPIVDALRSNSTNKTLKILLSPKGKTYNQKDALRLSKQDEIVLICGNYEGIDDRISSGSQSGHHHLCLYIRMCTKRQIRITKMDQRHIQLCLIHTQHPFCSLRTGFFSLFQTISSNLSPDTINR